MAKMTAKQRLFVDEYLIDLNATQAAIRAGYSVKTANEQGTQLLAKLSDYVDTKLAERSRRTGISQDRVLQELARIALVNPLRVIDTEAGEVRTDLTDDDAAAIAGVTRKFGKTMECSVRLHDKVKALELLGRHLGMYKDKLETELSGGLEIKIDYGDDSDAGDSKI